MITSRFVILAAVVLTSFTLCSSPGAPEQARISTVSETVSASSAGATASATAANTETTDFTTTTTTAATSTSSTYSSTSTSTALAAILPDTAGTPALVRSPAGSARTPLKAAKPVPQSEMMTDGYPGATVRFPITGDINALIVFVQRKDNHFEDCRSVTGFNELNEPLFNDRVPYQRCAERPGMTDSWDPRGVQSFTDNPLAEWPAGLPDSSARGFRQLPAWATGIIDAPGSDDITFGSLTDIYHRYSNGTFNFRGKVWPYTYIPEHNTPWYEENRGTMPNGLAKLNSEVIRFVDEHHKALGFDITPEVFDRYTNGRGDMMVPDGNFDMVIIVYRFSGFDRLMSRHRSASAIAHLGGIGDRELTLGGMTVTDNPQSGSWWENGSGIVANGFSQKMVMTVIMHEIGHRQFGGYHTNEQNLDMPNADAYSVMGATNNHTFSGPDKIKLNWANVAELDINSIPFPHYTTITLHDGNKVNTGDEILWIRNGDAVAAGDIIVEARLKTSFMDMDPEDLGLDGDGKDYSLPGNGLYIYKAQNLRSRNSHRYSSLQNGSLPSRRKYFGINDSDVVFGEGAQLLPFTRFRFRVPPSNGLDEKLAITHITIDEDAGTVSFRVWRHIPF